MLELTSTYLLSQDELYENAADLYRDSINYNKSTE